MKRGRLEAGGAQCVLQYAPDDENRVTRSLRALGLEELRAQDDVQEPRLVLQGQKDKALGRLWMLTPDDEPCDRYPAPVRHVTEALDVVGPALSQLTAQEADRMRDRRQARRPIVRLNLLGYRHR